MIFPHHIETVFFSDGKSNREVHWELTISTAEKEWANSGENKLIKKPKNRLLPTFSPDFTLNRQIWLFYAEKWIFLKKLGTLLN